MNVTAKTIGYAAVMTILAVGVAWLLTKMARTDLADRRLILIGLTVAGGIITGGLGVMSLRSGRRRKSSSPTE